MKVLVTGGLGFIGNELVRQFLRKGAEVAILDNRHRVAENVEDLAAAQVHLAEIYNWEEVIAVFRAFKPDLVVHLAAIHYIPECNSDPERTMRVNVEGGLAVIRASAEVGVKHLVFASSGAVYGDLPTPLPESGTIAPVDIYAWSKWFGEELCRWKGQGGQPITIARLFNTYGPRETNAHIIPEIIQQLRKGDVLSLGNIEPKRDFIYVNDTAESLLRLATRSLEGVNGVEVYNVASGHSATVRELVELMRDLLGRDIRVETDPARFRKADKLIQVADITGLEKVLGWKPQVGLRQGVEQLLRYEKLLS